MSQYFLSNSTGAIWDDAQPPNIGMFAAVDPVYKAYCAWHDADPEAHQIVTVFDLSPDEITQRIQAQLDNFAREHGFDSILSACTYATSAVPQFAADAARCVNLRDQTWAAAFTLQQQVQQGLRATPSWEEVLEVLPVLTWS